MSFVHQHRRKLHIAINTFARTDGYARWRRREYMAAQRRRRADSCRHSLCWNMPQAFTRILSAMFPFRPRQPAERAIRFYHRNFDVHRVVLPRVLSIHRVNNWPASAGAAGNIRVWQPVHYGGRSLLSFFLPDESPNTVSACSPARFVRWQTPQGLESRLKNDVLIDRCMAKTRATQRQQASLFSGRRALSRAGGQLCPEHVELPPELGGGEHRW